MIDNPLVSIVVPYYNMWILTHQRLMDLYQHVPDYCEIILIDDASTEHESANGITWWQRAEFKRHKIRYYRNPENVGFGLSCNNGIKLAKGKYVILLSNDVVVSGDFVSDMVALINEDNKMLVAGRVVDWAGGWNETDINGKHYIIPYAEGWLLGCTKIGWKKLKGFDPIYGKYDFEDVDLSMKALELGYNIVNLRSDKVTHLGSMTISSVNPSRIDITNRNRVLFYDKWKEKIPSIL